MAPSSSERALSRRARPGCGTYGGTPPARHRPGRRSGGAAARPSRSRRGWRPSRRRGRCSPAASRAWCSRWASSHLPGVVPVSAAKRRAKVRSDIAARSASSAHRLVLGEVLAHPGQQRGEAVRVAARAPAGRCTGAGRRRAAGGTTIRRAIRLATDGAELAAHVVQAGVDAGGGAGAGDHPVVLDEQHVGVDRRLGEAPLQLVGVPPVGGAGASVEQAGLAEQERARADREHPGAARVRTAEDVEHRLGRRVRRSRRPGRSPGRRPRRPRARTGWSSRCRCPARSARRGARSRRGSRSAGTPSSVRSTPKTSWTTPSSNKPGGGGPRRRRW